MATSLSYSDLDYRISSYRTDAGAEVDVILEIENKIYAIEIKLGAFKNSSFGGLSSFRKFVGQRVQSFVVIPEGAQRKIDDVHVMPLQDFLEMLGI